MYKFHLCKTEKFMLACLRLKYNIKSFHNIKNFGDSIITGTSFLQHSHFLHTSLKKIFSHKICKYMGQITLKLCTLKHEKYTIAKIL